MKPPRILVIAYACMPDVGSEPEAGWAWARIAAGIGDTWVLTRPWPARRQELTSAVAHAPEGPSIHIVSVDLPRWLGARSWDPYLRGHQRVEYMLWQLSALWTARRLARRERIDLVWHVTFSNVWMGSIGALVGPRFILGPVGGGVGVPWRLLPGFGIRGIVSELTRDVVRGLARYVNPLARLAWTRAELVLVQNPETQRWLPASARGKVEIYHNAVVEVPSEPRTRGRPAVGSPVALFAGRLLALKGAHLAVQTLAHLPGWRLVIMGTGPDERRLHVLARRLGVADRIEFRGWVAHDEVLRAMRDDADVFLFPSTHDEGSFVVAEAIAAGLPVVCLDRGGPPVVGGRPVAVGSERRTILRLARAVEVAARDGAPLPPAATIVERRRGVAEILRRRGIVDGPDVHDA